MEDSLLDYTTDFEAIPKAQEITLITLNNIIEAILTALSKMQTKMDHQSARHEKKLVTLEKDIKVRHEALSTDIETKIKQIHLKNLESTKLANANATDVTKLQETIKAQQNEIDALKAKVEEGATATRAEIDKLIASIANGDQIARQQAKEALLEAREAMILVNAVESHNRRWAVRILGMPVSAKKETKKDAKEKAVLFFTDNLKIPGINTRDIDCAHRVGYPKDGKQTMLVRFFERDYVDVVLGKKTTLKNSTFVLFEDATMKDRKLTNKLNDHDKVHSAWISNGTVWAKKSQDGDKFKVSFHDDIEILLADP
jgi:hypothetical protein